MKKLLQNENTKKRNSNIEMLRIISMFMIVCYHFSRNNSLWNAHPLGYIFGTIVGSWGLLGVDIFLVISAYYLSNQKFNIKKLLKLILQVFIWILVFSIVFILYDYFYWHKSLPYIFFELARFQINGFFQPFFCNCYWFITAYFFLLLLSPFMNKLLNKLSKNQMKKLLIVLIFVPIYAQFTRYLPNPLCDICSFIYIYLLVGYIRKYGSKLVEKYSQKPWYILLIIALLALIFLTNFLTGKGKILNTIGYIISQTIGNYKRHSIVILIIAILLVFNVLNKKPTYHKGINEIASHTLGVYLFHENLIYNLPLVTDVFLNLLIKIGIIKVDVLFPMRYLCLILSVFTFGILIETISYYCLQKPIMNFLSKKYEYKFKKINEWFNNF